MEDENDFDYEAARAAELQAICDEQFKVYMAKAEMFEATFLKLPSSEGNRISTEARVARKYESTTLSYGEIEFESFGSLLCSLTKYGVNTGDMVSFLDIGSGTGKAVICAALLGIFEKCTGIEIIAELNKASMNMLKGFYRHCQSSSDITTIEFILGDATFMDWSKTDLVFAHASCFDEASMKRICDTAARMKSGSVIIILSNRLPKEDLFTLLLTEQLQTSWGLATAFVYARNELPAPGAVDDPRLHLQQVLNRKIPF